MVADYWPLPPPPKRKAKDDPARPVVGAPGAPQDYPGLSKREELAKAALPAVIRSFGACDPEGSASAAVRHADALLAALAPKPPEGNAGGDARGEDAQRNLILAASRWRWFKSNCVRIYALRPDNEHQFAVNARFARLSGPNLDEAVDKAIREFWGDPDADPGPEPSDAPR